MAYCEKSSMKFQIYKYYYDSPMSPDKNLWSHTLYCSVKAARKAIGAYPSSECYIIFMNGDEFYIRKVPQ
jgi:hypothetical protein